MLKSFWFGVVFKHILLTENVLIFEKHMLSVEQGTTRLKRHLLNQLTFCGSGTEDVLMISYEFFV